MLLFFLLPFRFFSSCILFLNCPSHNPFFFYFFHPLTKSFFFSPPLPILFLLSLIPYLIIFLSLLLYLFFSFFTQIFFFFLSSFPPILTLSPPPPSRPSLFQTYAHVLQVPAGATVPPARERHTQMRPRGMFPSCVCVCVFPCLSFVPLVWLVVVPVQEVQDSCFYSCIYWFGS